LKSDNVSRTATNSTTTIFTIVAIAVITAILFSIFYSIATAPKLRILPSPSAFNNYTLKIPDGVTFKLVHKNGWHPCQEDPGVWCKAQYVINQIIQKYQNITPPPPPVLPQAYVKSANNSSDINITHTLHLIQFSKEQH
jgi:hypothetical protein